MLVAKGVFMKQIIVAIVLLLALSLIGCNNVASVNSTTPAEVERVAQKVESEPDIPSGQLQYSTWISPAKVMVGNFYPGARAEYSIKIHNGYTGKSKFNIIWQAPNWASQEYAQTIQKVQSWVMIVDPSPVLEPLETRDIEIAITMPSEAIMPLKDFEFWITVIPEQEGMVQTAMATRWLVTMR